MAAPSSYGPPAAMLSGGPRHAARLAWAARGRGPPATGRTCDRLTGCRRSITIGADKEMADFAPGPSR